MDIFRVLTRGTSVQHRDRGKDPQDVRLPSTGQDAQRPTLTGSTLAIDPTTESSKSKKRKRGKSSKTSNVADPLAALSLRNEAEEPRSTTTQRKGASNEQRDGQTGESGPLSEEETHRILNHHKLKVTWMNAQATTDSSIKTSKKRSHQPKDSKKNGLQRIFPSPLRSFDELQKRYRISRRLMDNLDSQGFATPTEVQMGSLPILLGTPQHIGLTQATTGTPSPPSSLDLLTIAPTGSGKTIAFLIPLIQGLLRIRHVEHDASDVEDCVRAIILAPTHELMDQIVVEGKKLMTGTGLRIAAMHKNARIYQEGQSNVEHEEGTNVTKTDVVVSTPMMLLNSLQGEASKQLLSSIRFLVFDEADVLLDPLFREQTMGIWSACDNTRLRVSFWSATMASSIEHLVQQHIAERRAALPSDETHYLIRLVVGLKDSSLPSIQHRLIYSGTEQGKLLGLRELLHPSTSAAPGQLPSLRPPFLVFTQTIERARALHSELLYDIPVEAGGSSRIAVLHSELSDHARSEVMSRFRSGEVWIIITTDLLSRGIDFRGINGVVNYDIPNTAASYVHRAGRTGRAGRAGGMAVTLYTKEDIPYVKNIANVIAATEKMQDGKAADRSNGPGLEKWLLEALPKVSRDARQEIKRRGIAARRTVEPGAKRSKEARRARISTKAGYDREVRNRRKGTIEKHKRHAKSTADEEWQGFDNE